MSDKVAISVVVNVHNESETLAKCLKSVSDFADEIIVIDMQSSDNSREIAAKYNAKIYPYRWLKFVEPARNYGISKANGRWILILDPDEYITRSLKKELKKIVNRNNLNFAKISRKNIIFGKWIRHSRMWPDYLIRFFKKGAVTWKKEIHSQPETKGEGVNILDSEKLAIHHLNYQTITGYVQRALRYSGIQADELKNSDYKLKISDFMIKPIQEFNSRFFASEGYKDGLHGLIFCLLQAISIAFIYIRLWEKQGSTDKILLKDSFVSASQVSIYEYSYWFTKYFFKEYQGNIFKRFFIKSRHFLDRLTRNF